VKTSRSGYTAIPGSAAIPRGAGGDKPRRVAVLREFVAVPLDVFDRVALDLEPEELALYLQLARLAWADGVDRCRVSRAELERRVHMSQLRLGKALAGLVEKRHVALLDRNREGTLYRVDLPGHAPRRASIAPRPAAIPIPSVASVGELARKFLEDVGEGRGSSPDEVVEEILALVEDGKSLVEIERALARFRVEAPKRTPIAELSRFL
jgi:hypothetical protein